VQDRQERSNCQGLVTSMGGVQYKYCKSRRFKNLIFIGVIVLDCMWLGHATFSSCFLASDGKGRDTNATTRWKDLCSGGGKESRAACRSLDASLRGEIPPQIGQQRRIASPLWSSELSSTKSLQQDEKNTLIAASQTALFEEGSLPQLIYENEFLLAVDKPPGLCYHDIPIEHDISDLDINDGEAQSDASDELNVSTNIPTDVIPGLVTTLRWMQQEQLLKYQGRLFGVHRLDRVTSGIVVFAKSSHVAGLLSKAFRYKGGNDDSSVGGAGGGIVKYYCALSSKKPLKKKQGLIVGRMIRARRGAWQLTRRESKSTKKEGDVSQTNRDGKVGRPGKTRFFTTGLGSINNHHGLVDFSSCGDESDLQGNNQQVPYATPKTFLLFRPITGQTHQLRVGK
jgi:23S rRNA-/tRNA-specific pseudouridylate synthase